MPAQREVVFGIWLDAQSLQEWMCAGATRVTYAEVHPVVGGYFRVDMTTPDGQTLVHSGEYLLIQPPEKLVFTWRSPSVEDAMTRVTVELNDHGDACTLTLTHETLPNEHIVRRHHMGWSDILSKLQASVSEKSS